VLLLLAGLLALVLVRDEPVQEFLNTSLCIDSTMDYIWSKMSESIL
jgi:hypothetical protein